MCILHRYYYWLIIGIDNRFLIISIIPVRKSIFFFHFDRCRRQDSQNELPSTKERYALNLDCVCLSSESGSDQGGVGIRLGQKIVKLVKWFSHNRKMSPLHLTHLCSETQDTHQWTHTQGAVSTLARSSGQPYPRHPGSSWGLGALLKGTSFTFTFTAFIRRSYPERLTRSALSI